MAKLLFCFNYIIHQVFYNVNLGFFALLVRKRKNNEKLKLGQETSFPANLYRYTYTCKLIDEPFTTKVRKKERKRSRMQRHPMTKLRPY